MRIIAAVTHVRLAISTSSQDTFLFANLAATFNPTRKKCIKQFLQEHCNFLTFPVCSFACKTVCFTRQTLATKHMQTV